MECLLFKNLYHIDSNYIYFENGYKLYSEHDQDCCECHYLSFRDLRLEDFKDLEFDLDSTSFYTAIPDYDIIVIKSYKRMEC